MGRVLAFIAAGLIAVSTLMFVATALVKFSLKSTQRIADRDAVRLLARADEIMTLISSDLTGQNILTASNIGRIAAWQREYQRELKDRA